MTDTVPEQRYGPTSGLLIGILGLACCAVVVGLAVAGGLTTVSVRVGIIAVGAAVIVWAFMLRPRIIVEAGGAMLRLRNPLVSYRIPLAAVRVVGVKTVTTIKTEAGRYDCVAVGYSLRTVVRGPRERGAGLVLPGIAPSSLRLPGLPDRDRVVSRRDPVKDEQTVMTDRILAAAERARTLGLPQTPVERTFAVPELVALGASVLGFVVTLFL